MFAGKFEHMAGHTVLPALVNAHDHLHLNSIPGLPDTKVFGNSYAWARAFAQHFERTEVSRAMAVPADVRHWLGALKNALSGTLTVMHHDPPVPVIDDPGFPIRVAQPCGWAHSLHWRYGPPVRHSFDATPKDAAWFIHLGEGTDDQTAGELQQLRQLGCLQSNTVLIHAVACSDLDIAHVIRAGAAIVWCPSSNLRILGRTLSPGRLRILFEAGCLALGTDSRLSGSRDLLRELRVAQQHSDFSDAELLELVTVRARRILRLPPASDDFIVIRSADLPADQALMRLERHQLRAVIRAGRPLITDPDLKHWFVRHGIRTRHISLDGQPKLCADAALPALSERWGPLEPGLEMSERNCA
jgi:cytosine/adenosine deaminase-related metal-dependent hydrolase